MANTLIAEIIRPYIRRELPGWGKLYKAFVGGYEKNANWSEAAPRIIRDKRCGYYRVLNIREWADRSLYFLGRWYDLPTALAAEAALRPGDRVADVGGNYGHFTMAAAHAVGAQGHVVTAEPNPTSFARLTLHVVINKLAHVVPRNIGISDVPGELTLTVPQINSGEASFAPSVYDDVTTVTCSVETLDMMVGDDPVDLVKIDVEGFEVAVLRGGQGVIARDKPIIITEIVAGHLERADASLDQIFDLLEPLDYKAYQLQLKKTGRSYDLILTPYTRRGPDDDVIWIPPDRRDRLKGLLPD